MTETADGGPRAGGWATPQSSRSLPTQWEYYCQEMFGDMDLNISRLNALGSLGWELSHVGLRYYLLKRQRVS